jgi:Flp pilus assembly protein TadB
VGVVSTLVAALYGLGFGSGLWLVVDGLTRRPRPRRGATVGVLRRWAAGSGPLRLAGAATAAALVGVWTRWPVAALLAAAGVWAAPGLLAGARTSGGTQARLEAVAGWAESLRGTLQAAAGLEQAILATAVTAPQPIRQEVGRLAEAIRAGVRLPEALRAFADDLDHPDGDRVVAALLLAATGHARTVADQLGALAAAAREQAAARLRVHTEWSTTRTSVRVIIAITVVMGVAMMVFNREFLTAYDDAGGQVMLLLVGVMFAAGFSWLARLSRIPDPPRVLANPGGLPAGREGVVG